MELKGAVKIEETAIHPWCNSQHTEDLNSHAIEQASLLTVALLHSFLVAAVVTYFSDSLASLDGMKGKPLILFLCS
jgi:hypothetical protein